MFKQIKYIFILLFILALSEAYGQQDTTLRQEVEVKRAYRPTITDANKINEMPTIDETKQQVPTFNYSIKSQPIINTFSVNQLKAATIRTRQKKETGYGLVRLGIGNYNKPYGELFFNHLNSKNSVLGIHAKHLSSHGKLKLVGGDKVDAPFSKNEAEFYYKHNFREYVLSADLMYKNDGFKYYGYPEKEIPPILLDENQDYTYQGEKQAFSKLGASIRLKNPVAEIDDPLFNFNLKYHYFTTKTKQTEHFVEFMTEFQKPFDVGSLLGEAGVTYVQADSIFNTSLNKIGQRKQTWLYASPAYYMGSETASLKAGINAWFVLDNDMDAVAKITPNIRASFTLIEDVITLYAGVNGDYKNNHYSKIAYENPFVNPQQDVTNSYEKLRFYGGIDGKLAPKTNFKISADYSMIDDQQLYFLNEYYIPDPMINPNPLVINNTFDILYEDLNLLKVNVEIFHASADKLNLLLSGNYYKYYLNEQNEAWNMPDWDATLSLDYKLTEQLSVGADIYLIGARKALIIEHSELDWETSEFDVLTLKSYNLDTTFDLNVNATYQITQKLAVFGQLNNFGFQTYQRWFGYPVQSFNALAGISYAF